jgi:type I restriction enzyme, S subunit
LAKRGTILVSVRAPVGDVNISREEYCIGRGLASIDGRELLDNWYLFYHLIYSKKRLEEKGTGSTFKSINKGVLQQFPIVLPPLPEQQAIAHVLNTVRQAIEATEGVIAAARELKRSMMKHLFTYGPVPVHEADQVPLKETEIGEVPVEWEVGQLGEHLELIRNGITKKQNKDGFGYPVTRIETISEDIINPAKVGYIADASFTEVKKFKLRENDILFSHINSEPQIGRSVKYRGYPIMLLHGMNLLCLRTSSDLLPDYLNYLFSEYRSRGIFIRIAARAVNQSSINQGKMKALHIPLPKMDNQKRISEILTVLDNKIRIEEQRNLYLGDLFNSLLHHLMTGKVRVPID